MLLVCQHLTVFRSNRTGGGEIPDYYLIIPDGSIIDFNVFFGSFCSTGGNVIFDSNNSPYIHPIPMD